jgi:hypothetical protein
MVRKLIGLCVLAFVLGAAAPALADWGHQVKWDQLQPSNLGNASCLVSTQECLTADDFLCTETGWITDIEFNGWIVNGPEPASFRITFWTDVPPTGEEESHPGELLADIDVDPADPADPLGLGWQKVDTYVYKINLPVDDWFLQEESTIYWIGIQGVMSDSNWFYWTVRDRTAGLYGDDAAYTDPNHDPWWHLGWLGENAMGTYEGMLPGDWLQSADMSFRLSGIPIPEPSVFLLATVGLLALLGRRKR